LLEERWFRLRSTTGELLRSTTVLVNHYCADFFC